MNQSLKGSSSTVSSMASGSNTAELQKTIMSELSDKQVAKFQSDIQAGLTTAQKQQLTAYTTTILTVAQKQQMADATQQMAALPAAQQAAAQAKLQSSISTSLTAQQQQLVQAKAMALLTPQQKQEATSSLMALLPKVQNMKTATLKTFMYTDGKVSSSMESLLPKNGKYLLISLPTSSKATMTDYQDVYTKLIKQLKKSGLKSSQYTTSIAGNPAVSGTVGVQIMRSMGIMLISSVIIMVIILLLVFPVRRRLLPLVVVLVGVADTFGLMGWLGIDITIATMATLPVLIGLGTDFGVQFLNRYEEEFKKTTDGAHSTKHAVKHMGPAVGTALIVMIFSFLTMRLSKAPLMKDFGVTLAIGVAMCYIVEIFLIFAILSLKDKKLSASTSNIAAPKPSKLNQLLGRYSKWVMKHSAVIVIAGSLLGIVGFFFESKVNIETDMLKMIPQDMPALVSNKKLIKTVGSQSHINYMVEADDVRDSDVMDYVAKFEKAEQKKYGKSKIESISSLPQTISYKTGTSSTQSEINQTIKALPDAVQSQFITDDHKATIMTVTLDKDLSSQDGLKLMNHILKDAKDHPAGIKISANGQQAMLLQGVENMTANHNLIIFAGLAIIFVVLLLVYRKLKDAIYPLLPIMIVLGISPMTLKLINISYNPITIGLSSLVLGIGTEFTILILERYSEERKRGAGTGKAIETAISSVGQAITVSALTVIGGFSTLMFVNFPALQSFDLITVLDTAYSLIMALTIMPAFIYLFRNRKEKKDSEI